MTIAAATTPGVALAEREDSELLALIRTHTEDHELQEAVREVLVTRYQSLVRGCVQRYRDSPEPVEDLMQVGYVGLLKAIADFKPLKSGRGAPAAVCRSRVSAARSSGTSGTSVDFASAARSRNSAPDARGQR